MQWRFFLSVAVAILAFQPSRGCSPPEGYVLWNISDRVQAADMVVWGRVLAKHGLKIPPATSYTAEVEFGCHVHGDTSSLVGRFNISKMGYENPHQCVSHNVDVGSYYFFFLTYGEEEILVPQDINQQSAVVRDTPVNRQEFFICCGFTLSICQPEIQPTSQPQPVSSTANPEGTTVAMTTVNVAMTTQNLTDDTMSTPFLSVGGASHLGASAILVLLVPLFVLIYMTS